MAIIIEKDEFYKKYGDVKVIFSKYYDYIFNYSGPLPHGKRIIVECGGYSNNIYNRKVFANEQETIRSLSPFAGRVYDGEVLIEIFTD